MKEFSVGELSRHDGSDDSLPVLLSVRGMIFDVSSGRGFYGPGGPYAVFAGKECARALALMSTQASDCTADVSGLSDEKLQILADWERKFQGKYPVLGALEGSGVDLSGYVAPEAAAPPPPPTRTNHTRPIVYGVIGVAGALYMLVLAVATARWSKEHP